MPLKLVTGPANAAKAGEVLGGLRARIDQEPVLVVPNFQDVEHSQRELADRGAVFGATVLRFAWLFQEIARRTGYSARIASDVQRELVVEEAIRSARLDVLRESSERPGFVRAAVRFAAELERSMVEPQRLTSALRAWAADGARAAYAEEVAAIYRGYRGGLEAAGLVDAELFAWQALDALRRDPRCWGPTPLFVYGFDDFTPLELDALEALSGPCEADVVVSLPFEAGRDAFRAIARIEQELSARADERVELEPLDDHYDDGARAALHHLERNLFRSEEPERLDPRPAVSAQSAGGERAEVELTAAAVLRLLREGAEPGDVAVVFRDPSGYASVVEQVFDAYGIPFSIDRAVPFSHTAVGRGLLALLRCACLEGTAEDLIAYLRTPGKLKEPGLADALEAEARQEGARSADAARRLWEERRWKLEELDRLPAARGTPGLLEELDRELERLFAGPYAGGAVVMEGQQLDDPRAYRAAHEALVELQAVIAANPRVRMDARRVHDVLADLRVRVGEDPQPDRVQVADPGAIRARRFEAVFICGLQEGEFPRIASPEPFLPDEDRREIAKASGLTLPLREDELERERYLFYACASRAERLLVLSSRYCDEEGNPQAPSFFVEDVRDLFEKLPEAKRSLSDVTWSLEDAPTAAEWERAHALRRTEGQDQPRPLQLAQVLDHLARQDAVSAGALESFADCPVKWLVDKLLRPDALEPDPEQMVRGRYAHKVLERTYARLGEETGRRRVRPENLADAERILLEELRGNRDQFPISPNQTRVKAAVRRLEFDLLRYLRHEAEVDGEFEPEHLEVRFGMDGQDPVEIAEGLRVHGFIDRVDTWNGYALVRDYKSGSRVDSYKASSWERENRFQAALYMMVAEKLFDLRAVGGVYTPLGGEDRRSRGLVAKDVTELGGDFVGTDRLEAEEFDEKLAWAREQIVQTTERLRRGELCSRPESCAWNGGCSHPSICRVED